GTAIQMTATGTYSDGSTQNITSQVSWTSSNISAATVGAAGLVTGVAPGTANITAAVGAVSGGSIPITITAPQTVVGAPSIGLVTAGGNSGALASNLVDATTGALSKAQVINQINGGVFSLVAADPGGRFVYAASGGKLYGYTIDAGNGALTPIPG